MAAFVSSAAEDVLWKENVSDNWNEATRWEGGAVPNASQIACLTNPGTNYQVSLYTTLTAMPAGIRLSNTDPDYYVTLAVQAPFAPRDVEVSAGGILSAASPDGQICVTNTTLTLNDGGLLEIANGGTLQMTNATLKLNGGAWHLADGTGTLVNTSSALSSPLAASAGATLSAEGSAVLRACDANTTFTFAGDTLTFADSSRLEAQQPLFGAGVGQTSEAVFSGASVLDIAEANGTLSVGGAGLAKLTLETSQTTTVPQALRVGAASTGEVNVVQGLLDVNGLAAGEGAGGVGTLNVRAGGSVTNRTNALVIGSNRGQGSVNVAGGVFNNGSAEATQVGAQNGTGTLRVADGGRMVVNADLHIGEGSASAATGRVCVAEGQLVVRGDVVVTSAGLAELELGPRGSAQVLAANVTLADAIGTATNVVRFVFGPDGTGRVVCGADADSPDGCLTIGSGNALEIDLGGELAHPRAWNLLLGYGTIVGSFADVRITGSLAKSGRFVQGEHDGVNGLWYCFSRGTAAVFR